jgi:hypothetical protein
MPTPDTHRKAVVVVTNQGGRSWTVIHDPRLPFIEPIARDVAARYDEERQQAWFLTKEQIVAINDLTKMLEDLPYYEIPDAKYVESALRAVPGVAVTKQPFKKADLEHPRIVKAVAITEEAYQRGLDAARETIFVDEHEAKSLINDLDAGKISAKVADEILDVASLHDLREHLEKRTIRKPDARRLRDCYTPANTFAIEKLVGLATKGTLDPRNCGPLAGMTPPIGADAATEAFRDLTQRDAEDLITYGHDLATPEQRMQVVALLNESADDLGGHINRVRIVDPWNGVRSKDDADKYGSGTIKESDVPTLTRRDATRFLARFAPKQTEELDAQRDYDDSMSDFERRHRQTIPTGSTDPTTLAETAPGRFTPYIRSPRSKTDYRENWSLYLQDRITQVVKATRGAGTVTFPSEKIVVMDVIAATPHEIAGFIDDAHSQIAIAEAGSFTYKHGVKLEAFDGVNFGDVMTGAVDPPLVGSRITLTQATVKSNDIDTHKLVPNPSYNAQRGPTKLSEFTNGTLKPRGDAEKRLIDKAMKEAKGKDFATINAPVNRNLKEIAVVPDFRTRFVDIVDRIGALSEQAGMLRARQDLMQFAPQAPIQIAVPHRSYHGIVVGRHKGSHGNTDGSGTVLTNTTNGSIAVVIPESRLPERCPIGHEVDIPAVTLEQMVEASLVHAGAQAAKPARRGRK